MYPVGTKCVITCTDETWRATWGQIVTVGERTWSSGELRYVHGGPRLVVDSLATQEIDLPPINHRLFTCHPISWMKPFANPDKDSLYEEKESDTSIMDDAEEIKRLSDEILS